MAIAYARVATRADVGYTVTDITLDGSYAAGGYALSNAALGLLSNPKAVMCSYKHATATSSNVAEWDPASNKIKIFEAGTAAGPNPECIAGDITSSHVIRATAYGDVVT